MTNKDILKQYVNTGVSITEYQFNKLNSGLKKSYLRARSIVVNRTFEFQKYEYNLFDVETQRKITEHIWSLIKEGWCISDKQFELCPDELKKEYVLMCIEKGYNISDKIFEWCNEELREKYIFDSY